MADVRICQVCGAENPSNARYCNQCGTFLDAAIGPIDSAITEERRWVTVLFADLVNYTALLEQMDPEDARELVSEYFSGLAGEIVQLGGTLDKFMGDAVMAIFGAPVSHEDDPARALRAALRMQRFMGRFNSEKGLDLHLRIGVNTGQVVVGARRLGGLAEFTATGDAVNVAARLQQAGKPGQIVAGEDTIRQAGASFQTQTLPPLQLRGKQQPVTAFLVQGERDTALGLSATAVPLVNRTDELARLRRGVEQLAAGRGRIFLLSGEPGIGKSRLIEELRGLTPPEVLWAEGRGLSHRSGLNYSVFRTMVQDLFDLRSQPSPQAQADHLRGQLDELGTPQAFPYLARLLNLPALPRDHEQLSRVGADPIEQRVLRDVGAMAEASARRRPNLIVMDDLHWADQSSITMLTSFMGLTTRVPMGLLLSFRSGSGATIDALRDTALRDFRHWTTSIELKPLSARQSSTLVTRLLGDARPSAALRSAVEVQGEGNPLFIEEVVRSLRHDGSLVTESGWPPAGRGSDPAVRVPISIQGIMLARLDRLPESTRHSLQVAAVIGREFDPDLLELVDPAARADLLLSAQQADLIGPDPSHGSTLLAFRHTLTREVIYRTLLLRRRRALHGQLADAIASRADDPSQEAELLAFHYLEAQRWPEVLEFATIAADRASASFASRDAVQHYTQALAALDRMEAQSPQQRAHLLQSRGAAHERTGEWQRAQSDYEAALEATAGDDHSRQGVLLSLARLLTDHDEYRAALTHVRAAQAEAERTGERRVAAQALTLEARVLVRQSRAQEAVERLNRALAVHRELGDRGGEADALDNLAAPLSLLGDVDGAYEHQTAALQIFTELGDSERGADVRSVLGEWRWFLGDFEGALREARAARAIHEELGVTRYLAHDQLVEGMALATLGHFKEALATLDHAARLAEQTDQPQWVAHALVPLGVVNRALRRFGAARRAFNRAHDLGRAIGATFWAQLGTIGLGLTALGEGNIDAAEQRFRSIMAAPDGLQFSRARAMAGLAMVELARGNLDAADDWARWSIAITEGAPYVEALLEAQIIRGRILAGQGNTDEAVVLLKQVMERARETGARPLRVGASRALSEILSVVGADEGLPLSGRVSRG